MPRAPIRVPVKVAPAYSVTACGKVFNSKGKQLRPTKRNGRDAVGLYNNGVRKFYYVHRLVVDGFIGLGDGICRHLNGKPWDNNLSNLKEGTYKENSNDAKIHGTYSHGKTHGNAKLQDEDVIAIRKRAGNGEYAREIASDYGMSEATTRSVINGRRWKHLPGALKRKPGPKKTVIQLGA